MKIEWDAAKRRRVLSERGLDFAEAAAFFDGRPLLTVPSPRGDEERWLSIGELQGRMITVVWLWRQSAIRIVTMRRARHAEAERYRAAYR